MMRKLSRPVNGFTLIELLVVVAIIAILAGILLPALGKAKASARKVKCIAQMREVAVALNQFAYDNKNRYPGANNLPQSVANNFYYADLGGEGTNTYWCNVSVTRDRPLFQYIETLDLFECPGDRGDTISNLANVFDSSGSSYFYPLDNSVNNWTFEMGIEFVENQKLTLFTAPSKKVLVFEPTFFKDSDEGNAKTKWHTDSKASVIGYGDGHAALTESENYTRPPSDYGPDPDDIADERAGRDYY
jgi:prepilin-type N-terminal cleavage/methylation domain-containing protein